MDARQHLEFLQQRRSVRCFDGRAVPRDVLARLIEAATTAPSATNRQPWRFSVVESMEGRASVVEAVRGAVLRMKEALASSDWGQGMASYSDFFYEPLVSAAAIVVPQFRTHPDVLGHLLETAGARAEDYPTAASMQVERCATSAAVMNLLAQAEAEGLGACWMAGPMLARAAVEQRLDIRAPWQMLGAIALGYSGEGPKAKPERRPLDKVLRWF